METLRAALSLQWTYVDAIDAQHPAIGKILDNVREQRSDTSVEFRWPSEIDTLASSSEPLDIDNWMSASTDGTSRVSSISGASSQDTSIDATPTPLVCATQDNSILPYAPTLSQYRILSPEKIACWYSHLAVIRQVAEHKNRDKNGATIILEDDIDMEWDIRERLGAVWNLLPAQWDIVFLGAQCKIFTAQPSS
jgi:hypothetical protein